MTQLSSYDPNWKWGKHEVEITLMRWDYVSTHCVQVGGNTHGLNVMDCAVGSLYDSFLPDDDEDNQIPSVKLIRPSDGAVLICFDDEDRGEDWLQDMVVSLRIVGWYPMSV